MRLLVVCGFDSQLKWGRAVSTEFAANGWQITYFVPNLRDNQLSNAQIEAADLNGRFEQGDFLSVITDCRVFEYDAVVVALLGNQIERFIFALYEKAARLPFRKRPVTIAGYVGIVIDSNIGGFMYRRLADIVCTNSSADADLFKRVALASGLSSANILHTGLALLRQPFTPLKQWTHPRTVLFAAQPTVPGPEIERLYLLHRFIEYAHRFPDRKVIFKPRHRLGEDTIHKEKFHYETLLEKYYIKEAIPHNFVFSYDAITELLPVVDLCVSVSSTAVIEAYANGIPFAVLSDLGVKEGYGTAFFVNSGALTTFDNLLADKFGALDPAWIAQNIASPEKPSAAIYERVLQILDAQAASGRTMRHPGGIDLTAVRDLFAFTRDVDPLLKDMAKGTPPKVVQKKLKKMINKPKTTGKITASLGQKGLTRYEHARRLLAAGDARGAERICREALKRTPHSAKHLRQMARILNALGRKEKARDYFKAARAARWRVLGRVGRWLGLSASPAASRPRPAQSPIAA